MKCPLMTLKIVMMKKEMIKLSCKRDKRRLNYNQPENIRTLEKLLMMTCFYFKMIFSKLSHKLEKFGQIVK